MALIDYCNCQIFCQSDIYAAGSRTGKRVKVVMSVSQNEDWIEQTLVPQDKTNQGKGTDWRRELKR